MAATIRPDDWNLALFVHVAGAMLVVASLVVVLAVMGGALRRGDGTVALTRLAFRGLFAGVLPAYVVMRVGAEWIASKEGLDDSNASWLGIGYGTADGSLLLTLVAIFLAWRATRRGDAGPGVPGRAVVVLAGLLLVAYAVTIWAMATKPA